MKQPLEHDLEVLRTVINTVTVREAEQQLTLVTRWRDPESIGPLLCLLDDQAEYAELMFSLIHAAEAFDYSTYFAELLKVLPEINSNAPDWARVLIIRLLNDEENLKILTSQLKSANVAIRIAATDCLKRVRKWAPKFVERVDAILAEIGSQ